MKILPTRQLLTIYIPSISILVAIAAASAIGHIEVHEFTRDMAGIADVHPLTGILSSLGILLWCVTASIGFFAAIMGDRNRQPDVFWFLIVSGCLSTYMLLDDLYMFHELLAPRYLGLREEAVLAVLVLAILIYIFMFRRTILQTYSFFLLLALIFLTTSVVVDRIFVSLEARIGHWEGLVEDGAKWLGIVSWCTYFVHTSGRFLLERRPVDPIVQPD